MENVWDVFSKYKMGEETDEIRDHYMSCKMYYAKKCSLSRKQYM